MPIWKATTQPYLVFGQLCAAKKRSSFYEIATFSHHKQQRKPSYERTISVQAVSHLPCINAGPFSNYAGQTHILSPRLSDGLWVTLCQTGLRDGAPRGECKLAAHISSMEPMCQSTDSRWCQVRWWELKGELNRKSCEWDIYHTWFSS